jgi:hypothetical protein
MNMALVRCAPLFRSTRPAMMSSALRFASSGTKAPLVNKSLAPDGILTLRFNNEKKVHRP